MIAGGWWDIFEQYESCWDIEYFSAFTLFYMLSIVLFNCGENGYISVFR